MYQCERLLSEGFHLVNDVVILFANTGWEHPKTLEFVDKCFKRWEKIYGVTLSSPRTVATIPTKDISMITILPESNTYLDSKVYFIDGSVEEVLNMVQKGVNYSGNVYFNV